MNSSTLNSHTVSSSWDSLSSSLYSVSLTHGRYSLFKSQGECYISQLTKRQELWWPTVLEALPAKVSLCWGTVMAEACVRENASLVRWEAKRKKVRPGSLIKAHPHDSVTHHSKVPPFLISTMCWRPNLTTWAIGRHSSKPQQMSLGLGGVASLLLPLGQKWRASL